MKTTKILKKKKAARKFKSAVDGQFVSPATAKLSPATTYGLKTEAQREGEVIGSAYSLPATRYPLLSAPPWLTS